MGRLAWTNHIYFQITQPGSSTVASRTNRGGSVRNYDHNTKHLHYLNLRKFPGTEEAVQETNNRPAAGEAPQPGQRPQQIRRAQCGFRQGQMILLHPSQRA
jgi:hypothetical protein